MFNFIIEEAYTPAEKPIIIQDKKVGDNKYKLIFKTILQEADVPNQNKRVYPKSVLEKVVQQLQPKAKNRELLSELDHPWVNTKDQDILKRRAAQVRLSEVCCLIRDIQFDGKYVIAECETLTNQKGLDLYGLIKDGVNIGFSLRAFGPVRPGPDGTIIVGDDIKAITYDVVSNPSHSNARILEFLNEDINLFKLDNNELLIEDTSLDSNNQPQTIYLPIGAIVNDLNEDDLSSLQNDDNINVQAFSISIDPDNNQVTICNNNQCVTKSLDDLVKVIIGRGRYAKLTGDYSDFDNDSDSSTCDFYPLVGFGRAIKLSSLQPSNYTPFLNPITDPAMLLPDVDDTDIDDTDDIDDIDPIIQLNNAIDKSFENDLDLLEYLLNDENISEDKIDELFESIYNIAARKLNESKDILFLEDYFDHENIEENNILSESTMSSTTNIDDYINDEDFEYGTTNIDDLDFQLNYYLNEIDNYLSNINNIVLSNYNKSLEECIQELNSIPSILEELYLEDQKYNENSILDENNNISEYELDILLDHLLKEYYKEIKESLNISSDNTLDSIFFEHIFYDFK